MAENSNIVWCDHTFNPWEGCTKIGPGCDHCYAENRNQRFSKGINWGKGAPRRRTSEANWKLPLKWNREAERLGIRYRVFCSSLADVFDNEVDPDWRIDLFDLIRKTPSLNWLLLSKRVGNISGMINRALRNAHTFQEGEDLFVWLKAWDDGVPPKNVWLGATVVNQEEADRDIPKLLSIPAVVHFLSMEPLLGAVDIRQYLGYNPVHENTTKRNDCVRGSEVWRTRNNAGRNNMESPEKRLGQMEEESGVSTLQASSSGTPRTSGISSDKSDVEQQTTPQSGSQISMVPLQRRNSKGADNQSQERNQIRQSSQKPRIGDAFRATDSRDACAKGGPCVQPDGGEELHGEVNGYSSDRDSEAASSGRTAETDSSRLRSNIPSDIENSPNAETKLSWLICGGESGSGARPMNPDWVRSLRDQCKAAGVAFFMKQLGGHPNKRDKLEDLPAKLRIREFPNSHIWSLE